MSKELEALEEIGTILMFINKNTLEFKPLKEVMSNYYNIIEKSLQRLEQIDNANSNEALECFERIDNTLCLNNIKGKLEFGIDDEEHIDCDSAIGMAEDLETIKEALEHLEAIDNANPSEALKCFDTLEKHNEYDNCWQIFSKDIKVALLKAQEQEKENELLKGQMKYLTEVVTEFQKGIRVINEKNVDISYLKYDCHFELCLYNKYMEDSKQLTQEELDLLKMIYI